MMTFTEMIQKNPNLWPDYVSEIDKQTIINWFQFREVGDDLKFPIFFKRELDRTYNRYLEMVRIEPGKASYDWFVINYNESLNQSENKVVGHSSSENSGRNTTINNLVNTTKDGRITSNVNNKSGEDTTTSNNTTNNEGTSESHGSEYGQKVAGSKSLPQDSSGLIVIEDNPAIGDNLTVSTLSLQALPHASGFEENSSKAVSNSNAKSTNKDTSNGTNTVKYGSKDENITSVEGDLVNENTGTVTNELGTKVETDVNDTNTGKVSSISTGRSGYMTSDILTAAVLFISETNAFNWLKQNLESCFLGVFEI